MGAGTAGGVACRDQVAPSPIHAFGTLLALRSRNCCRIVTSSARSNSGILNDSAMVILPPPGSSPRSGRAARGSCHARRPYPSAPLWAESRWEGGCDSCECGGRPLAHIAAEDVRRMRVHWRAAPNVRPIQPAPPPPPFHPSTGAPMPHRVHSCCARAAAPLPVHPAQRGAVAPHRGAQPWAFIWGPVAPIAPRC